MKNLLQLFTVVGIFSTIVFYTTNSSIENTNNSLQGLLSINIANAEYGSGTHTCYRISGGDHLVTAFDCKDCVQKRVDSVLINRGKCS